jgi:hypothetical protein
VSALSPLVSVGSSCSGSKSVALADVDTLAMLALLAMSPPENRAVGAAMAGWRSRAEVRTGQNRPGQMAQSS